MDKSSEWKVAVPVLALTILEVAAFHLVFGGAHRLGLGLGVEYAAMVVGILAGLSLSVFSVVMFLRFKRRHNLKVHEAFLMVMAFLFGLLPVWAILLMIRMRLVVQDIISDLGYLRGDY